LQVKCVSCGDKFNLMLENFSDHEIVFCPTCGLDHMVLKGKNRVVTAQIA